MILRKVAVKWVCRYVKNKVIQEVVLIIGEGGRIGWLTKRLGAKASVSDVRVGKTSLWSS